jgi:hypothetical protein
MATGLESTIHFVMGWKPLDILKGGRVDRLRSVISLTRNGGPLAVGA